MAKAVNCVYRMTKQYRHISIGPSGSCCVDKKAKKLLTRMHGSPGLMVKEENRGQKVVGLNP